MNEVYGMSDQETCEGSHNATSSPASADGRLPSNSPESQGIEKSGPDLVRANLSARQAKERGLLTSGTYGRRGSTSSASADLTSSLASKLAQRLDTDGSILFKMTWKVKATIWRPLSFLLAALGLPILGRDSGLFPALKTPKHA